MKLTQEQKVFLQSLGLQYDFEHLSVKQLLNVIETVEENLELEGLDDDYEPNTEGKMCESILDALSAEA